MASSQDTSLDAGELPEGTGTEVAEPVSLAKQGDADVRQLPQPEALPAATSKPVVTSANLAMGPIDEAIPPIPAVDLTAEALTRYLRDRRHSEIRDEYPIHSSPSGHPSGMTAQPAIASPTK